MGGQHATCPVSVLFSIFSRLTIIADEFRGVSTNARPFPSGYTLEFAGYALAV